MEHYSRAELADMHMIYGEARGRDSVAQRLYQERFPNRRIPGRGMFARLHQRIRDTGTVDVRKPTSGRPPYVRTDDLEEDVLQRFQAKPSTSTRAVAAATGTSQTTVWRIVRGRLLHPFRCQKVQALCPADFPARVAFATWFLQQDARDPDWSKHVLFTDEATFTREGVYNTHNNHVWADINPHATRTRGYQHRFNVNVWAGVIENHLLGPYIMPKHLTGENYNRFLQETLPELFDNIPLGFRQNMWYMHDGAPAHFARTVRDTLNTAFPGRWIGRGGPVAWPARSPDLNPLDFFVWGHLQSLVYETPVDTADDLVARIAVAAGAIQDTPDVFHRVRESLRRRCQLCRTTGGRHFEHLL